MTRRHRSFGSGFPGDDGGVGFGCKANFDREAFELKSAIELHDGLGQGMGVKATTKRRAKSEGELLEHATNNLLRALKGDMLKKDGRVDREKLRKDGYSERLLDRLEQA
jgi:hypothetical protein